MDDQRDQLGRIGFERHAPGQRHQDLARVVLRPEEAAVEPALGGLAVAAGEHQQPDAHRVEQRPSGDDLGEREVALAHQRQHQRHRRQDRQQRDRALGHRVLQAAAQHRARAEDVLHRDGVGQAERRQEHERTQHQGHGPGQCHRSIEQQRPGQGQALGERPGERARHAGVDHHLDAPPLVGVGIAAVAADALDDDRGVDEHGGDEGRRPQQRPGGEPCQRPADRIGAEQVERRQAVGREQRRRHRQQRPRQPGPARHQRRRRREVEDRPRHHREAERRQQPGEDRQRLAHQRRHPGLGRRPGRRPPRRSPPSSASSAPRPGRARAARPGPRRRAPSRRCGASSPGGRRSHGPIAPPATSGNQRGVIDSATGAPPRMTVTVNGLRTSSHHAVRHAASVAAASPPRSADRSRRPPALVLDAHHLIAGAQAGDLGGTARRHLGHDRVDRARRIGRSGQPERRRIGQRPGDGAAAQREPGAGWKRRRPRDQDVHPDEERREDHGDADRGRQGRRGIGGAAGHVTPSGRQASRSRRARATSRGPRRRMPAGAPAAPDAAPGARLASAITET